VETYQVAHLNIQDVNVVIVFLDSTFDSKTPDERRDLHRALAVAAAREGPAEDVVLVWKDPSGGTRFMAPPEQHPFFRIMQYDQLRAQVNRTLVCGPVP
jgi:hypothetical protein